MVTLSEEFFGQFKELIKLVSYESMKIADDEDPKKAYKRNLILEDNMRKRNINPQNNDGSVVSMEDLPYMKEVA